jgi:hypothetical protein
MIPKSTISFERVLLFHHDSIFRLLGAWFSNKDNFLPIMVGAGFSLRRVAQPKGCGYPDNCANCAARQGLRSCVTKALL